MNGEAGRKGKKEGAKRRKGKKAKREILKSSSP
jgi:hypothetical protein